MAAKKSDRRFMEIAVQEMRKSKSEHPNKFDPIVGAVLVDRAGHELGRSHRGGLRVGDHAEYQVIERMHANQNLQSSTLYVTLEPCTRRDPPKIPCAKRIVSARIGKVVIGMPDPNPDIHGHGIDYLLKNNVEVDFFDLDLIRIIYGENEGFQKQYEAAESGESSAEDFEGPSEKEKQAVTSASLKDFAAHAIKKYLDKRGKSYKVPSAHLWSFFSRNGFVVESGGSHIPTVAGLLLFGESPEDFLVQSKIKLEAHQGNKVSSEDVSGPLVFAPDRIKDFFERNVRVYTEIKGFERLTIPEYPWEALREAVMNALAHRDYGEGARIMIQMLEDRIVVKSPGRLLRPLSLEMVRAYNAPPFSRNPRIAETFGYLRLMEERGWGFGKMRDLLRSHGLPPPHFAFESGYFVVTFLASRRVSGAVVIGRDILAKLNTNQKEVIRSVQANGKISRAECVELLQSSSATAKRVLKSLVDIGLLEMRGKSTSSYYVLIDT